MPDESGYSDVMQDLDEFDMGVVGVIALNSQEIMLATFVVAYIIIGVRYYLYRRAGNLKMMDMMAVVFIVIMLVQFAWGLIVHHGYPFIRDA